MGKRPRKPKKVLAVCEEEERERIKASILQVFRAHCSSPSKEGAVLVGPSPSEHKKARYNVSSPSSEDSSPGGMSGRKRQRKKLSAVRRKKCQSTSRKKNVKEVEENPAISRHMKVAHGITHCPKFDKGDVTEGRGYSTRLTQRLGLFNTGKKSAPASRGLVVPPHINEKTNEGIKRMVAEADSDLNCSAEAGDGTSVVAAVSQTSQVSAQSAQSISASCSRTPASVEMKQIDSPSEDDQSPHHFDTRGAVIQLMSKLKSVKKMVFPGRDVLEETREELLKLLKQKSATPTPLPLLNKVSRSGSVQRSLLESFTSITHLHTDNSQCAKGSRNGLSNHQPFSLIDEHLSLGRSADNDRDINCRNNLSQIQKSSKRFDFTVDNCSKGSGYFVKKPSTVGSGILQTFPAGLKTDSCRRKLGCSQSNSLPRNSHYRDISDIPTNSALTYRPAGDLAAFFPEEKMLSRDDFFFVRLGTPVEPVLESVRHRGTPRSPMLSTTATALLEKNDIEAEGKEYEGMECDQGENEALSLLQQNEKVRSSSCQLDSNSNRQQGLTSSFHCQGETVQDPSQFVTTRSNLSDETSAGRLSSAAYMPSFHDNYYSSHMEDLSWQKTTGTDPKSWDLLDYADIEMRHEVSPECRQTDKPSTHTHREPRRWSSTDRSQHFQSLLPPREKSPDGLKMYPRKMY